MVATTLLKISPQGTVAVCAAALPRAAYEGQPLAGAAAAAAKELAVEADNHRRAGLLGGVQHALQRLDAPAFKVANRVPALAAGPASMRSIESSGMFGPETGGVNALPRFVGERLEQFRLGLEEMVGGQRM